MSKLLFTAVTGGLLLVCSAGAYAADGYYPAQNGNNVAQSGSLWRGAPPPVQSPEQGAGNAGAVRRFYSYQPPAARGQRAVVQPFVRPASAKARGEY